MVEFNRKKQRSRLLYSPVVIIFLCLLFFVMLKALWGVYQKERISAQLLEREQIELSRMENRQKELSQAVEFLRTDRGVEAEIRSKFRVVKEGESVAMIVVDEPSLPTTSTTSTTSTTTPPGFFQKIFNWFN